MIKMNGEGLFGMLSIALGGVYSIDGYLKYGFSNFNELRKFFALFLVFGVLITVDDAVFNEKYLKKILGFLNLLEE